MIQEQQFIKEWDTSDIKPANVVDVYVSDNDDGHIVPLLISSSGVEGNANDYEAIDLELGSEIAGAGSIHTLGENIFNRYIKFDGYTCMMLSQVYENTKKWGQSFIDPMFSGSSNK